MPSTIHYNIPSLNPVISPGISLNFSEFLGISRNFGEYWGISGIFRDFPRFSAISRPISRIRPNPPAREEAGQSGPGRMQAWSEITLETDRCSRHGLESI